MKSISRRHFARNMALSGMMMAIHPSLTGSATKHHRLNSPPADEPRILGIRLLTSAPMDQMREFYKHKLEMEIVHYSSKEMTILGGKTPITFIRDEDAADPWYHFAFNIPENKILKAREWHLERTPLIPAPWNDPTENYPDDVRHFHHWNSHSLFFWDPAGNLLEYIARHDMNNAAEGDFTREDILYASEIAYVVDDQPAEARLLNKHLDLDPYPKSTDFWWAMGDESGLVLCIPKRLWGENTPNPKRFGVHRTEATILGHRDMQYQFGGFPYEVRVKSVSG
jgi:hypothetical protein